MKRSPEFFANEYLPTLARYVSFTQTARALGINESTVYVWLQESRAAMKRGDDPSDYLFAYQGEERRYLHQWIKQAQKASISDIESNARARARDGYYRVCRFQGKTVWRDDPKLVGFDDRTLDMLGFPDRLLRINGELQPETEWVPGGTDLIIAVLQSNSELYRRRSSVDVNMSARVSGGVMVMGGSKPPSIAAPLPMVEIIQEATADDEPDTVAVDDEDQAEFSDVTDTPPDAPEPEPGPMIRAETPAEYAPAPAPILRTPLTSDERAALGLPPDNANVRAAVKGTSDDRR
jgi:hypothetical protein